ncbi:hypothetical protein [Algirhabdus cladophorae]|uniref:hypothetical protein n=1 Tax=Algirhabdus cladophorae TaxID=3377108 RepID=UPI003B8450D4
MRLYLSRLFSTAAVAICMSGVVHADQAKDFQSSTSVSQIAKMGAKQMAGTSIQKIFAGRTLKNPNWTWTFKKNGVQSSKANDGAWTDKGTWEVKGNEFCRQSEMSKGKEMCSKVYVLGRDLKFSDHQNAKKLKDWYISY